MVGSMALTLMVPCHEGASDSSSRAQAAASRDWIHSRLDRGRTRGVNFSATLENPFDSFKGMEGMDEILVDLRAGPWAPVIVCVHYACPHIEYLDRGKSRVGLE
jgi:hypothetical protein